MSTVHECTVARQCGIQVFAFSLITNVCVMEQDTTEGTPNVDEIFETAVDANEVVKSVIVRLIPAMGKEEKKSNGGGDSSSNGSSDAETVH